MTEFDKKNIDIILNGHGDWFTAQLLRLITKADMANRAKLSVVFPEEVKAVIYHLGLSSMSTPTTYYVEKDYRDRYGVV